MAVKTYDPKKVILLMGGVRLSGFADGTFVEVTRDEDSFTKKVGADGETARARSNNKGGSIKITLLQTSPSNAVLSAYLAADESTNEGVKPVTVKDLSQVNTFFSASGWIKKPADAKYSKEIETREWTIDVANLEMYG